MHVSMKWAFALKCLYKTIQMLCSTCKQNCKSLLILSVQLLQLQYKCSFHCRLFVRRLHWALLLKVLQLILFFIYYYQFCQKTWVAQKASLYKVHMLTATRLWEIHTTLSNAFHMHGMLQLLKFSCLLFWHIILICLIKPGYFYHFTGLGDIGLGDTSISQSMLT